ncbi:FAD-binding oxidoreductase [Ferrimicrobium sp.]|nr:FAD-binding oxidoreductase [Ferrimicrobium sp.]
MSELSQPGRPRRPAPIWQAGEVVEVVVETPETSSLRIQLPQPEPFLPGQYYNIRIPVVGRPRPIQRAYSVGSSPHPRFDVIEVGVKEMEGGLVSPVLVRECPVGSILEVRGPYGAFTWTEEEGGPVLLIGAGSGVVPLMAMIRYQVSKGTTVPMHLVFSSKSAEYVIYRDELSTLAHQYDWLQVTHTFTRETDNPLARYHRRIDKEMVEEVFVETAPKLAYLCGPPEMVDDCERSLLELGLEPDVIKTEKYD